MTDQRLLEIKLKAIFHSDQETRQDLQDCLALVDRLKAKIDKLELHILDLEKGETKAW